VLTNLYHDRQLYITLIPPSHESQAVGLRISRLSGPVELTLRYTTPDMHCRHTRHECDGGIKQVPMFYRSYAYSFTVIDGLVQFLLYFAPREGAEYCDEYVCLFVCLSVCSFVCMYVCMPARICRKPHGRFSAVFVHVACGPGSVLF